MSLQRERNSICNSTEMLVICISSCFIVNRPIKGKNLIVKMSVKVVRNVKMVRNVKVVRNAG